jgi:quercetin dioxygenase-like cupin family protein
MPVRHLARHLPRVLLHGDETDGRISVTESAMSAGAEGPPLHTHVFGETFYVLDGELTFQLGDALKVAKRGEVVFAPGGIPHTLANRARAPARFLIICAPAGFERELARRAAARAGVDPPPWAMQPVPQVTVVGPRIGEAELPSR